MYHSSAVVLSYMQIIFLGLLKICDAKHWASGEKCDKKSTFYPQNVHQMSHQWLEEGDLRFFLASDLIPSNYPLLQIETAP